MDKQTQAQASEILVGMVKLIIEAANVELAPDSSYATLKKVISENDLPEAVQIQLLSVSRLLLEEANERLSKRSKLNMSIGQLKKLNDKSALGV